VDRQPAVLPLGERGVRLHRRVRRAGRAVELLDDRVGLREAGADVAVADAEAVADVGVGDRPHVDRDGVLGGGAGLLVELRRAAHHRGHGVGDRRQLLVGDVHEPSGRPRRVARRRGDRGDDVAGVAGAVGEHALVLHLAAVEPEVGDVVRREHHDVVGDGRRVDADHARVRMRRAHERGVQHAGPLDLRRVAQLGGHARVHTASTARATSAAITRRRYFAEPRESDSGSIRSA
jgi:hypothetical protein